MAQDRGYTAGRFAIALGRADAGFARSVQGGQARADVVKEAIGDDRVVHKHIANLKYEDIVLEVGSSMSDAFFEWVASAFGPKHEAQDGTISFEDYSGVEKRRLLWKSGRISAIEFSAPDATSKEVAYLRVTITPESTANAKGSGVKAAVTRQSAKKWVARDFRLTIAGVDCSRVRRIDGLTISRLPVDERVGGAREAAAESGGAFEIPNLVVAVAEAHAGDFVAWHDDFVIKGNSDDAHEKEGKLEWLAPDGQVLFTLQMSGLGIFGFSPVQETSGNAAVATVEAELYCEEMSFEHKAPAVAPPAPPASSGGEAAATGTVIDPASALASALRTLLDKPAMATLAPETAAARLLATTTDRIEQPTDVSSAGERGRKLGADWARERGTLDELEQVTAVRGGDWTNLVLAADNSLLADLQTAGAVPEGHEGPLTLERDPFVEGVVEGAADVFEEVRPHLVSRPQPA